MVLQRKQSPCRRHSRWSCLARLARLASSLPPLFRSSPRSLRRRVEAVEPPRLLRLRAGMRLPGRAWLEWEAREAEGGSLLVQTAYFEPKGLTGFLYWWALYPIHRRIFSDLARAIVREAEAQAEAPPRGGGAG